MFVSQIAKINCTNVDSQNVNQPSPLVNDGSSENLSKAEMTRSQSNYNLINGNDPHVAHLKNQLNGNLTKNSFSSSNLNATKLSNDFKVMSCLTTFVII